MKNLFIKQWPSMLVYTGIAISMVIAVKIDFRVGAITLALSVIGAFALRYNLPDAEAGWLRSRRRRVDLTFLATLGFALLILALIVPHR